MGSETDAVLHDATSLYRFVDAICSGCVISGEYPSYLESSQHFFRYIRVLGERTKVFLEGFPQSLTPANRLTFNAERQKLATLRLTWFELHEYIRPAVDAHSLNIPSPLLVSLLRRFRSVQGLQDQDFIILHTDQVNYFEAHAPLRSRAEHLRAIIPDAPRFPSHFGVIEFPYSQAESVFLNCLIAHEMGHFLFDLLSDGTYKQLLNAMPQLSEQNAVIGDSYKDLLAEIGNSIKSAFGTEYDRLSGDEVRWCRDVLLAWAEEIFCDFFALWIVGPCFTLAYIELLDLAVGLYPSTAPSDAYAMSPMFTRTHPARLFRLREHSKLLKNVGWWNSVTKFNTHFVDLLKAADATPESQYKFSINDSTKQHLTEHTLQAFFLITSKIETAVQRLMTGVDSGVDGYRQYHKLIENYLREGVVPSTVIVGNSSFARKGGAVGLGPTPKARYPDFIAILNSAYKFYLESLPALVDKIENAKSSSCKDRNQWLKRLEVWTMKAIEDSELLNAGETR